MATYEFKSLAELAQHLEMLAKNADGYASSSTRTTKLYRAQMHREASTYYHAASIVRNSVIKPESLGVAVRSRLDLNDPKTEAELNKVAAKAYFEGERSSYAHERNGPYFVAAIKAVRNATGLGLKEAKDWCDERRDAWEQA